MRLALALFFALQAPLLLGVNPEPERSVCVEPCDDDRPDGSCDSNCSDCACCAQVRVIAAEASRPLLQLHGIDRIAGPANLRAPAPEADEILHVPKAT